MCLPRLAQPGCWTHGLPLILSSKPWVQCRDLGLYSNSSSAAH